jgi:hypothetical protein
MIMVLKITTNVQSPHMNIAVDLITYFTKGVHM